MPFLIYLATALLLLLAARRWVVAVRPAAAAALLLLPLCFTGRALLTSSVYGPIDLPYESEPLHWMRSQYGLSEAHNGWLNDVYTQMIPYRQALRDAIGRGEWPLWNDHTLSGEILAAAAQPAAYSPFTLLALLLPVAQSFTFTAAILFFLAGLCAFAFSRELGCRETVALIAAAGWMYSTALAFFILWPHSGAWGVLPLILLAVRRVVRGPSVRTASLLTCGLTLLVVAGHPESVLHAVSIGFAYGVFELMLRDGRERVRAIGAAAAAGVVTLLLCAIYLLPIAEATPQTAEYDYRHHVFSVMYRGVHPQQALVRLATDFVAPLEYRRWTPEHIFQVPPDTAGVGSIVLALAVYALWRVRCREKWFFAGVLVFCIVEHTEWWPLTRWLHKLPLFDIALNARYSFGAALALVVLAALGAEEICRSEDARGFALFATAVLLFVTVTAAVAESSGLLRPNIENWGDFSFFAEIALLALLILIAIRRVPSRVLIPIALGLLLMQRVVQEGGVYPTLPADAAYPHVPLFDVMKKERAPFRVVGQGLTFVPGTSAMYGLEDVRGYAAMTLARYVRTYPLWCVAQPVWFNRVDDLSRTFLSFLNVRYAVTWDSEPPPPGWREAARYRRAKLLENTRALERAFVPALVHVAHADVIGEMADVTDFHERAWVEAPGRTYDFINGPGRVSIRRSGQGFDIDASMDGNGWIVVSEPAWNGWRAYIDGRRVEHQIANVAFLGVYTPKGHHRVRLVYFPHAFVIGRAITLGTMVGLIAFAFVWRRRERG